MSADEDVKIAIYQRLHAMETKLRRLKQSRNGHSDNARSYASQRNAVNLNGRNCRET